MILRQLVGYALAVETAQVLLRVLTNSPPLYRWDNIRFAVLLASAVSALKQMYGVWVKDKSLGLFR